MAWTPLAPAQPPPPVTVTAVGVRPGPALLRAPCPAAPRAQGMLVAPDPPGLCDPWAEGDKGVEEGEWDERVGGTGGRGAFLCRSFRGL